MKVRKLSRYQPRLVYFKRFFEGCLDPRWPGSSVFMSGWAMAWNKKLYRDPRDEASMKRYRKEFAVEKTAR